MGNVAWDKSQIEGEFNDAGLQPSSRRPQYRAEEHRNAALHRRVRSSGFEITNLNFLKLNFTDTSRPLNSLSTTALFSFTSVSNSSQFHVPWSLTIVVHSIVRAHHDLTHAIVPNPMPNARDDTWGRQLLRLRSSFPCNHHSSLENMRTQSQLS